MLAHRHMGPQGKGLEYHSQIPLLYGNHVSLTGVNLIIQADDAAGRLDKTAYDPKQSGLAAAGRSQDGDKFRIFDIQVNFLEGLGFVEAFCDLLYM